MRLDVKDDQFKVHLRQHLALEPSSKGVHHEKLNMLAAPHLDAFNSLFEWNDEQNEATSLVELAVRDIGPKHVFDGKGSRDDDLGNKLELWIEDVRILKPMVNDSTRNLVRKIILPSDCRERGTSYKGRMQVRIAWKVNDGSVQRETRIFGEVPIMVGSKRCHLEGKSPKELIDLHEDPEEFGGYFIVNGIERLIRLLIAPRRNYPIALVRGSFTNRGSSYTDKGVQMRCVRPDQSAQTITVHYLTDGQIILRFIHEKQEYMVPVLLILKALVPVSDSSIFERLVMAHSDAEGLDTFLTERIELLLRAFKQFNVRTQRQCLAFLGSKFAVMLDCPENWTDEQCGRFFLDRLVCVHTKDSMEKFDTLIFMIQKLYSLVAGSCIADNPDSMQLHEVLLGGHVYLGLIKERLAEWLNGVKTVIKIDLARNPSRVDFLNNKYIQKAFGKVNSDVGSKLQYFLATGNLVSRTGLDLQQVSGFTIVAEKLNFYRYISHFRSIHRGAFFAELKTTAVRKLLPEAWGFLCPVHTPDGSPCGLLNHLSHTCRIVVEPSNVQNLPELICSLGASQMRVGVYKGEGMALTIQLDGRLIGWTDAAHAKEIADKLRYLKVSGHELVPSTLEIGYVPVMTKGQYPGIYLFSTPARMVRPVEYLATGALDWVGSFEQVYMEIACLREDLRPGSTTHMEYSPTHILSVVANLTPFSDFNQSPRNMYQCQMGKQSMGTPTLSLPYRTDNKLYRLQTGQTPVVRPTLHNEYGMDNYPNGMNAIVCVISYTGYDMEDAMILNKASYERGFGYGTVYKTETVDLTEGGRRKDAHSVKFGLLPSEPSRRLSKEELVELLKYVDIDGLPHIGRQIKFGEPLYAYVNDETGRVTTVKYKGMESGYIDQVLVLGNDAGTGTLQHVSIKYRIPRPPIIGDKFSSRHGQKGVCSQKWPVEDMPFSESGMTPDIIINPHAFPSRMTIGMFVESIAGKAGALLGHAQDSTPFQFSETNTAADHFGKQLVKAGFNFHGNEPMYSGITGEEFNADIYLGVVYYQRLRHMVSDKYQVRTVGPVQNLTQQPVKGRKRHGGIRFGEMERDSLLAHGTSFLLQDRLLNCSDYTQSLVCVACGSILSPIAHVNSEESDIKRHKRQQIVCLSCKQTGKISVVAIPYVFKYLATELFAMGVKLQLDVK